MEARPRPSTVLSAALWAGLRAFVLGCGGHMAYRFSVHHLVPFLHHGLSYFRRRAGLAPGDPGGRRRGVRLNPAGREHKGEEEKEETDGPLLPLPEHAASCQKLSRRRLWWLYDSAQNEESLRLGSFLGTMVGGFRMVEFALQVVRGKSDGWNPFLAGTIAGLSIAFDSKGRQKAISLYLFFKSCGLVWNLLVRKGLLSADGPWAMIHHTIWCLLCGVMMYCFFFEGDLLDSFVYRFLYNCTSPCDQYAMSYVRKQALGMEEDPEQRRQERLDYASGRLHSVPPPIVVKRREHFARDHNGN